MSPLLTQCGHRASLNGPHLNRYDVHVRSLGGGNETARVHHTFDHARGRRWRLTGRGRRNCKTFTSSAEPFYPAANKIRVHHQRKDSKGAWSRRTFASPTERRRSDRITILFAALHESAIGPKRTSPYVAFDVAIGVKQTCQFALHMSAFDPKRT